MIKENYTTLKKEYPDLPSYEDIDKEFEICLIEKQHSLLRGIKRRMAEKYELTLEVLEHIVNPDPSSFVDLHECSKFTTKEKNEIVEILRRIMNHYRIILETDLIADDAQDAQAITTIYKEWIAEKENIIPIVKKLRESWQEKVEPRKILEYLG